MFFRARPKSPIFGCIVSRCLDVSRMLSGLRSLCTMLLACKYETAWPNSQKIRRAWPSIKRPSCMMHFRRSPPSTNSMTRYKCSSVWNQSKHRTIPGCWSWMSMFASSLKESCESRLFRNVKNLLLSATFTARFTPLATWTPSLTSLKLPLPTSTRRSQLLRTHCSVTKRLLGPVLSPPTMTSEPLAFSDAGAEVAELLSSIRKRYAAKGSCSPTWLGPGTQMEISSPCTRARVSPFFIGTSLTKHPLALISSTK
mmetsp:Transcript_11563/g.30920  ORF Transcript_11563/g.30920 Transcript_11563/m.30920 type:complete len:255 (-) Transcript_11563:411-1175(-)